MVDYEGQQLSEKIMTYIFVIFCIPGWIYGYIHQDFYATFKVWALAATLATLITVPDFPFYNKNPVVWRKNLYEEKLKSSKKEKSTKKQR